MNVVQFTRKGYCKNTREQFHIYIKKNNSKQLSDKNATSPNQVCDIVTKSEVYNHAGLNPSVLLSLAVITTKQDSLQHATRYTTKGRKLS
jgi:hypothetical protein